jgi:hypothetical protein
MNSSVHNILQKTGLHWQTHLYWKRNQVQHFTIYQLGIQNESFG